MEKCYYMDHHDPEITGQLDCRRVYLGHETCEKRLPTLSGIRPILRQMQERGIRLTMIFPFLTEEGLLQAKKLIEFASREVEELEVAASDWGLLYWLSVNRIAIPSVGRLLVGQKTDPRLSQYVLNEDIRAHLSSCTLLKKESIAFFNQMGIHRFEISNSFLPLQLPENGTNRFSLHTPYTPIAVMRWCMERDLDFNKLDPNCSPASCRGFFQEWKARSDDLKFYRIDNALYFFSENGAINTDLNRSIDRVVVRGQAKSFDQHESCP